MSVFFLQIAKSKGNYLARTTRSRRLDYKSNSFIPQMGPFEVFAYGPTLKFKLSWSGTPVVRPPRRPTSLPLRAPLTTQNAASTDDVRTPAEEADGNKENRKKRIFYQFIYNNNTRQQTEAREDLYCPWCSIDCRELYSLLKHLKLCHRRFIFTYAVRRQIVSFPNYPSSRLKKSFHKFRSNC